MRRPLVTLAAQGAERWRWPRLRFAYVATCAAGSPAAVGTAALVSASATPWPSLSAASIPGAFRRQRNAANYAFEPTDLESVRSLVGQPAHGRAALESILSTVKTLLTGCGRYANS